MSTSWVMVDLDGTECDTRHRAHLVDRSAGEPDWDAYCLACIDDPPIPGVVVLVDLLRDAGYHIAFVTGRSAVAKDQTIAWLEAHHDWKPETLLMRQPGNHQRNSEFKLACFHELMARGQVVLVIDDHPEVVEMFSEMGVAAMLVARDGVQGGEWHGKF